MQQTQPALTVRNMAFCALFTVLIIVGAWIRIPTPIVPITLQTLFVCLAGSILGSRLGAISAGLYLVMGLIGIPVFTGGGGLFYDFQPTFGYILGFILGAWTAGRVIERIAVPELKHFLMAGFLCLLIIYLCGMGYYFVISRIYLHNPVSVRTLMLSFFLPFLPGDGIFCILGAVVAKRIRPLLMRISAENV